jgi:hypothetical protein
VQIIMAQGGQLLVDVGFATFNGKHLGSQDDLAEVLLTAFSFDVDTLFREYGIARDPESTSPSAPVQRQTPGGIIVPPAYKLITRTGIDTQGGDISKAGGPNIMYEVGGLRGLIIPEANRSDVLWKKTLVIRGSTVEVFMRQGGELRVGVRLGNFIATNVKTNEDVADVLLVAFSLDPDILMRELGLDKLKIPKQ